MHRISIPNFTTIRSKNIWFPNMTPPIGCSNAPAIKFIFKTTLKMPRLLTKKSTQELNKISAYTAQCRRKWIQIQISVKNMALVRLLAKALKYTNLSSYLSEMVKLMAIFWHNSLICSKEILKQQAKNHSKESKNSWIKRSTHLSKIVFSMNQKEYKKQSTNGSS